MVGGKDCRGRGPEESLGRSRILRDGSEDPAMASCHTLPLEDSRDRVPLPRFGGDDRERPADDAAAEAFDSLQGALHAPRRWGLSSEAIGTWGARLYEFGQRFRGGFKPCTRDTSGRAYDSRRGQLPMDGERDFGTTGRAPARDDGT